MKLIYIFFLLVLPFSCIGSEIPKYYKYMCDYHFDCRVENIDKVYVINLDRRFEKWERINALLREYKIRANRFSAIDGMKFNPDDMIKLTGKYPSRMRNGQAACFLSHLSVMKNALDHDYASIWIMEDDIEILQDPHQISHLIKELDIIDPNWDIFYTDIDSKNSQGNYVRSLASDFRPDTPHLPLSYYTERRQITPKIQKIGQRFGQYSYIISQKGMKKVLDFYNNHNLWSALDIEIHYIPHIREYATTIDIVSVWYQSDISDTYYLDSDASASL